MTHTPKNRETLVNPVSGDRVTFLETATETGGAYLRMHHVVQQGAKPPYHWHPVLEETFTVIRGRFEFTLEGKKRLLGSSETVTIKPRMRHSFQALEPGSELEHVVRPAGLHQQMFEATFRLAREGKLTPKGMPRSLTDAAVLWELMEGYVVGVPTWLQRWVLGGIARWARQKSRLR